MPKFAKIFTVKDDHQVLIMLRTDEDIALIHQETYYQDVYFQINIGFEDDEAAEQAFKEYSKVDADKFFAKAIEILDGEPSYTEQDDEPESDPGLN